MTADTSPAESLRGLRTLNAGNRGPFTLDGTRTYLVGTRRVAVIDPGPDDPAHVRGLAAALASATDVTILLTHGHADHADAAPALAEALGCTVLGPHGSGPDRLNDGNVVSTDAGDLVALWAPGHTADHLCFAWESRSALFAGDLLLGHGDTTWVAGYPGCVADYLDSLDRIERMTLDVILPAHGPPLAEPVAAIARFREHRRARIEQVRTALAESPGAGPADLVVRIYGASLPSDMVPAATASIEAVMDHLATHG